MNTRISLPALVMVGFVLLAGCGEVAEFVLDDDWALSEIRAGDAEVDNLSDHLSIEFDAIDDQVSITVGPGWDRLSPQDPTGTYEFDVTPANSTITLSQDDEKKHEISYAFSDELCTMEWTRWEAVDPDPDIVIVSSTSTITAIEFERVE